MIEGGVFAWQKIHMTWWVQGKCLHENFWSIFGKSGARECFFNTNYVSPKWNSKIAPHCFFAINQICIFNVLCCSLWQLFLMCWEEISLARETCVLNANSSIQPSYASKCIGQLLEIEFSHFFGVNPSEHTKDYRPNAHLEHA